MSGFTLSYIMNMFFFMILHDFCLFPARFCYIIYTYGGWNLCANLGPMCTLENFQWCIEPCFACASILRGRCRPLIPMRGKGKSLLIWSVPYGSIV
jgi:hypothetical protein